MLVLNQKQIDELKNVIEIQCSDGNWNAEPYLHGMANGLLLAESIIKQTTPEFLEAPKKYLKDDD